MQFKTLFVFASFVAASVAQNFAMVESGIIMKIAPAITNFNATIHDFPMLGGGTVEKAMAIHYSAMALIDAANNTTDTINNMTSKFSDDEGMKILSDLEVLEPKFMASMKGIIARLSALRALPRGDVASIIKKDLEEMKDSADAFINEFNDHASPKLVKEAEPLENFGDVTFQRIMSIY